MYAISWFRTQEILKSRGKANIFLSITSHQRDSPTGKKWILTPTSHQHTHKNQLWAEVDLNMNGKTIKLLTEIQGNILITLRQANNFYTGLAIKGKAWWIILHKIKNFWSLENSIKWKGKKASHQVEGICNIYNLVMDLHKDRLLKLLSINKRMA